MSVLIAVGIALELTACSSINEIKNTSEQIDGFMEYAWGTSLIEFKESDYYVQKKEEDIYYDNVDEKRLEYYYPDEEMNIEFYEIYGDTVAGYDAVSVFIFENGELTCGAYGTDISDDENKYANLVEKYMSVYEKATYEGSSTDGYFLLVDEERNNILISDDGLIIYSKKDADIYVMMDELFGIDGVVLKERVDILGNTEGI